MACRSVSLIRSPCPALRASSDDPETRSTKLGAHDTHSIAGEKGNCARQPVGITPLVTFANTGPRRGVTDLIIGTPPDFARTSIPEAPEWHGDDSFRQQDGFIATVEENAEG